MKKPLVHHLKHNLGRLSNLEMTDDRFLVAISGGKDSVVLGHLCLSAGLSFGLAHCNFQLRGADSDNDEVFVHTLAEVWNVPVFTTRFNTTELAQQQEGSIQMTARYLRYNWLEEVRKQHQFKWILTAHHVKDSVETFFINLTRVTGLSGLTGIPFQNDRVIRPLFDVHKDQIEAYYVSEKLTHREDHTNAEQKYLRNKIRHTILPAIEDVAPAFISTMEKTMSFLRESQALQDWTIQFWKKQILERLPEGDINIRTVDLTDLPGGRLVLFSLLQGFGYASGQMEQIWKCIQQKQTGAIFNSASQQLLVDREKIILRTMHSVRQNQESIIRLPQNGYVLLSGGSLMISDRQKVPVLLAKDMRYAFFDADCLKYPLAVRKWQAGDRFQPLGMNGQSKKLKDYFTDQKWSRFQKESAWLLIDDTGTICWIVGERQNHICRVTPKTQAVVEMVFYPNRMPKNI